MNVGTTCKLTLVLEYIITMVLLILGADPKAALVADVITSVVTVALFYLVSKLEPEP